MKKKRNSISAYLFRPNLAAGNAPFIIRKCDRFLKLRCRAKSKGVTMDIPNFSFLLVRR